MSPIMYISLMFAILCWDADDVGRISLIVFCIERWLTFNLSELFECSMKERSLLLIGFLKEVNGNGKFMDRIWNDKT